MQKIIFILLASGLVGCATGAGDRFIEMLNMEKPTSQEPKITKPQITENLDEQMLDFHKMYCKKNKMSADACSKKFDEMIFARIVTKYPFADYRAVDLWCAANPLDCENGIKFEVRVLVSNNEEIERARSQGDQPEEARKNQAMAASLQQLSSSFRPKLNCATRNAIGGPQAVCD